MGLETVRTAVSRESETKPWGIGIVEKGAGHRVWVEVTDVVPGAACAVGGVQVCCAAYRPQP